MSVLPGLSRLPAPCSPVGGLLGGSSTIRGSLLRASGRSLSSTLRRSASNRLATFEGSRGSPGFRWRDGLATLSRQFTHQAPDALAIAKIHQTEHRELVDLSPCYFGSLVVALAEAP
jgi:hypothetical protein